MIKIKSLEKYFNKGRSNEIHVINDVDLELPSSGMTAIYGRSGCGKTTLLNVIGGLDRFDGGEVYIDGNDIRVDTDERRNKYIGYIFQNYNLSKNESCFENVASALRLCGMTDEEEIAKRVNAALIGVGMEKFAKRLPDTLSGGQQQRIAIARAIVKNPPVILADEPTGNLDEANTIMVMDLIKAISRDRLVLLVTHEEELVDHYCDTVIELSDGKVTDIRTNEEASGITVKNKNDIYLGEYEKTELGTDMANIEYYGDMPESALKLRIVNKGGKIYLKIDTPGVQVLDNSAEARLIDGVFEEKVSEDGACSGAFDMSALPPLDVKKPGRLFTWRSSLASGYRENFKSGKKGKKALRSCLALFAAVIVFMSAVFGTKLSGAAKADKNYNKSVFYVYAGDGDVMKKLTEAIGKDGTGIEDIRVNRAFPLTDASVSFNAGSFETFKPDDMDIGAVFGLGSDSGFSASAVFMDTEFAKGMRLLEGKNEALSDNEVLISSALADKLIENSPLGYVSEYKDLIGFILKQRINNVNPSVAGIVESDDSEIYLTPMTMARYVNQNLPFYVYRAGDFGIALEEGKTIYVYGKENYEPVSGKAEISGMELDISERIRYYGKYSDYLTAIGASQTFEDYLSAYMSENSITADKDSDGYKELADRLYFAFLDEYYGYLDAYIKNNAHVTTGSLEIWLYTEKGVAEAEYYFIVEAGELYRARLYRDANGEFPKRSEIDKLDGDIKAILNSYDERYAEEFYRRPGETLMNNPASYLVSDADYIKLSKTLGKTDEIIKWEYENYFYLEDKVIPLSLVNYALIHSSDPSLTEEWLYESFPELDSGSDELPAIMTPKGVYAGLIKDYVSGIISGVFSLAVVFVLMSVCMYFIMRSSLLTRIKEIGIYRAIGVSKKNIVFKFFTEALLLATLTVLVGYILSGAFIYLCLGISPLAKAIFFYPPWMALLVLALLYGVTILAGIIPALILLVKSPSEILAKYDI